jgi:ElaB/YqjD/DUF883 family membrane-anchored ribosome-binding protein
MNDDRTDPNQQTREQIEAEIERSRTALSSDLHALGEKLSPDKIKESAKDVIREVKHAASDSIQEAKEAASDSIREARDAAVGSLREAKDHAFASVTDAARDIGRRAQRAGSATSEFTLTHALPLSLVGLGVGWLMLSIQHQKSEHVAYGERGPRRSFGPEAVDWGHAKSGTTRALPPPPPGKTRGAEATSGPRGRADELGQRMRAEAKELGQQMGAEAKELGQQASALGHRAYDQLERAQRRTSAFAGENPLAIGALALAAGVGMGMLLPATSRENALLGETRDRLVDDAQRAASRLGSTVQRTGEELKGALAERGA